MASVTKFSPLDCNLGFFSEDLSPECMFSIPSPSSIDDQQNCTNISVPDLSNKHSGNELDGILEEFDSGEDELFSTLTNNSIPAKMVLGNSPILLTPSKNILPFQVQCSSPSSQGSLIDKRHTTDPGKNARLAKENRERKKKYVAELEARIALLQREKEEVSAKNFSLQTDLSKSLQENATLRTMLQNSSALAQVLTALGSSPSISFSTPNSASKRESESAIDEQPPRKRNSIRRGDANLPSHTSTTTTVLPVQLNIHVHSSNS